jgi:hypothetical protein
MKARLFSNCMSSIDRFAVSLLLAMFALSPAFGAKPPAISDFTEIKQDKEKFMSTLESMPYASEGSGPVLYLFEFSDCPYCQALEREWKDKLEGVEVRRFFYGVNPKTSNETAALALSRDSADFHAYMNRTKVAPNFKANNISIDAFNSVISPLQTVLLPTMQKNGWPLRNPVSPQFMWETNGHVYVQGGYTREQTALILKVVRSGQAKK